MGSETTAIDSYLREIGKTAFFRTEKIKKGNREVFPEGSFVYYLDYYRSRAPGRMRWFRWTGVIVIAFSAALPLAAAFLSPLWPSLLAVVVALATGLNAFYRWDAAWQGYIGAQLALERLHQDWENAIAEARTYADVTEGREKARSASELFVSRAYEVIEAETKGYFSNQRFPESKNQNVT